MRRGHGLFEAEPAERQPPQGRPAGVDKRFRAFYPHQVLLLPRRWTAGCPGTTSPGSSSTRSTTSSTWP
ncbi:hypothetical protein OG233_12040 [Streptomyces sp. NBC_01218]|uniref:hypothetical protein n=1 Tax=Streptomyces sp. NBC_01218 TaxID=2903780 RepID=UPI002E120672|nr:hypothetical protein OG233_12040 [Streptomyces sp. NBC_01218]